jgi:hypothetical protein
VATGHRHVAETGLVAVRAEIVPRTVAGIARHGVVAVVDVRRAPEAMVAAGAGKNKSHAKTRGFSFQQDNNTDVRAWNPQGG